MYTEQETPGSLLREVALALGREVFLKTDFLHYISVALPRSSFGFIHQWEVAEGGSARVSEGNRSTQETQERSM